MSNSITETTKRHFGDYASILLENHAIIPLNNDKNIKAASAGWQHGWDPAKPVEFHSLAVRTGAPSGFLCWDFDDKDTWSPPAPPNVVTSKGQHIYTPYNGEKSKIGLAPKLDLLSDNRYAIFHGPGKVFKSPAFSSADVMNEWFNSASPPLPCIANNKSSDKSSDTELEYRVKIQSYNKWLLEEHGITLDMEAVRRQYVNLVRVMGQGARNNSLFRHAREAYRCGLDMEELAVAAEDSGLDRTEIAGIIDSAIVAIELNPGLTVWDRVQVWKDTAWPAVPEFAHSTLEIIGDAAIRTNNLSPWIPQQDIVDSLALRGIKRSQQGVSATIASLEKPYGVVRRKHMGFHGEGYRNPLCYTLCIEGQPVSEVV